ncbi:MAG: hypothetical protein OWQ47_00590 [Acidianus infernus]|nr:hypothetical protein [Acidianus infernus]
MDPLDKIVKYYLSSRGYGGIPHSGPAGI